MTEKEKCRQGLLYDANYDAELLSDREKAKEQLYDYNRLRPSQQEEKTQLLKMSSAFLTRCSGIFVSIFKSCTLITFISTPLLHYSTFKVQ